MTNALSSFRRLSHDYGRSVLTLAAIAAILLGLVTSAILFDSARIANLRAEAAEQSNTLLRSMLHVRLQPMPYRSNAVYSATFSPDGKHVLPSPGAHDGSVRRWDVQTGKEITFPTNTVIPPK